MAAVPRPAGKPGVDGPPARHLVEVPERRVDGLDPRPRLVVAHRQRREGLRHRGDDGRPVEEAADRDAVLERVRRRAPEAGAVREGDRRQGHRARLRAARPGDPALLPLLRRSEEREGELEAGVPLGPPARRPPPQEQLHLRDAGHRREAGLRLRDEPRPLGVRHEGQAGVEDAARELPDVRRFRHRRVARARRRPAGHRQRQREAAVHRRVRQEDGQAGLAHRPRSQGRHQRRGAALRLVHALHLDDARAHGDRHDRSGLRRQLRPVGQGTVAAGRHGRRADSQPLRVGRAPAAERGLRRRDRRGEAGRDRLVLGRPGGPGRANTSRGRSSAPAPTCRRSSPTTAASTRSPTPAS